MKYYHLILIVLYSCISIAQERTNKWYFGEQAGLDFSSTNPIPIVDSSMETIEANASISDEFGNLLFYTDGINIWDSNNNIMPNGTGLLGNMSTSQLLIIPKPKSNNLYYIIYGDNQGGPNGLRFSEINMDLNNGYGDIILSTKNTLMHNNSSEKMSSVYHCNGIDVWVMTMNYVQNQFYAYLLTDEGIQPPVISASTNLNDGCCQIMKFSPNGSWLAYTVFGGAGYENSKLFSFNALLGEVEYHSDLNLTYNSWEYVYGVSFSPDNSKLYYSGRFSNNGTNGFTSIIYQYDMNSPNINSSKTLIHSENFYGDNADEYVEFGSLQNAKNGKIYLAKWGATNLGVINNPNLHGTLCDFSLEGVLLAEKVCGLGLPNFNESYFNQSIPITCDELSIEENTKTKVKIYPNPTNGNFNIELSNSENIIKISLYSVLGERIIHNTYYNEKNLIIDISSFKEGIYFLSISTKYKSKTIKLVKQ